LFREGTFFGFLQLLGVSTRAKKHNQTPWERGGGDGKEEESGKKKLAGEGGFERRDRRYTENLLKKELKSELMVAGWELR